MAIIKVDFFSTSLLRTVTINAIVPVDKMTFPGAPVRVKKPFKTLYLLHGIFGNYTDWVNGTRIQAWAQDKNLVVIMPSGENKFYVDNPKTGEMFSQFIGKELVQITRDLFPLSNKREDTFIGGLSMGGYGALINGLRFNETFSHIAALSSGLVLDKVMNSTYEDGMMPTDNRGYYEGVFGDLDQLIGSEKDYNALIKKLVKEKKDIPNIYLACGTEDFLISQNRDFHRLLKDNKVKVTYVEGPGTHNWEFWDTYIYKVLEWLPLEKEIESVHSGNVTKKTV